MFHVIHHPARLQPRPDRPCPHLAVLPVRHGEHDGIVAAELGFLGEFEAVFLPRLFRVGPGVVHVDLHAVVLKLGDEVGHAGVSQVKAVFLEGEPEDEDTGACGGATGTSG